MNEVQSLYDTPGFFGAAVGLGLLIYIVSLALYIARRNAKRYRM